MDSGLRKYNYKIPFLRYPAHVGKAYKAFCGSASSMHTYHKRYGTLKCPDSFRDIFIPGTLPSIKLHGMLCKSILIRIDAIPQHLRSKASVTAGTAKIAPHLI